MARRPRVLAPLASLLALGAAGCAIDPGDELGAVTQAAVVCAEGETVYGIDVSRFQGAIDWPAVAGSGVQYAFIQISRAIDDIDARFEENWAGAAANGILKGAYQRFHPGQDVLGQAQIFLDKLGPYQPGDLPPVLDVEDADGLPPAEVAAATRTWLEHVEGELGVRPIIYTGRYFWQDEVGGADFTDYQLWIANYNVECPNIPAPWTEWLFHQYSSTAVIPGITANTVDVNTFNGSMDDLRALAQIPVCGDGVCTGDEDATSCAADCPVDEPGDDGDGDGDGDGGDDDGAGAEAGDMTGGCAAGGGAAGGLGGLGLAALALIARRPRRRR